MIVCDICKDVVCPAYTYRLQIYKINDNQLHEPMIQGKPPGVYLDLCDSCLKEKVDSVISMFTKGEGNG